MKIGTSASNTLVTNVPDQKREKFKIQATGKAFSILSNALYQHKVKAVVREIGCNAYDAHIDARNTQTPFDVSLPTKEDPHFKVRDYGIGLAEDKFVEVYTTYFGSSKSDSNDHTGGLGLGSKTPFIMSQSFTVHSYYNGTEYMWHSFVNDNGEPDVMLLTSRPTTEHNGLQVIVPIGQGLSETERNALFRQFAEEAQTVYGWFDTIPNVTANGNPVTITSRLHGSKSKYTSLKLTGVENTTVYYSCDQDKVNQGSTIYIKMGNVVYPYDLSAVRGLDRFGGNIVTTEAIIRYITNTGRLNPVQIPLVIDVDMGAVDIAPSREALSLNNATELTIINAVVRFVDMFFESVQASIDAAKNTYDKYQALYLVPPCNGRLFKVDGKEINPASQSPVWTFGTQTQVAGLTNYLRVFDLDRFSIKYRRAGTRGLLPAVNRFDIHMYGPGVRSRTIILVDKPYKGELRQWVNANTESDAAVVVVFGIDAAANSNGYVQRPMNDAEMAPFLEDKHPQVIKFSELKHAPAPTPARAKAASKKLTDDTMMLLGRTDTNYNYFTVGNSTIKQISDMIKPHAPKMKHNDVFIAFRKTGDKIACEVQTSKKDKTLAFQEPGYWSRSQISNTNWQAGCQFLQHCFKSLPAAFNIKSVKATIDGSDYQIPIDHIHQVVLNKDAYAEIVGNPDYPQVYTVDRAIKELILPLVPSAVITYSIDDTEMFVPHGRTTDTSRFFEAIGAKETIKWMGELDKLRDARTSNALNNFNNDTWVRTYGYELPASKKAVTHTYSFSCRSFFNGLVDAYATINPEAAQVLKGLTKCGFHIGSITMQFSPGRYYGNSEDGIRLIKALLKGALETAKFNSTEFDEFIIDYYERNHTVS